MARLNERSCRSGAPLKQMFTADEAFVIKRFINSFQVRMGDFREPFIDRSSAVGEYVIYLPKSGESVSVGVRQWRVTRSVSTEEEVETVTLTIQPGLRAVVGGSQTVEPEEHTIELTESESSTGVWIVKQFSNVINGWVAGVQVIPLDDTELVPICDTVLQDEVNGSEYIDVVGGGEEKKGELLDVSYRLFPENLKRQSRVIAKISAGGVVTQYAYGSIYAIGDPEKIDRVEDTPEDEVEDAEEEDRCDQNTHPGSGDAGDPIDDYDNISRPFDPYIDIGVGIHPGEADCYTTR